MSTVGTRVDILDTMDSERVDIPHDRGDCSVICPPSEILEHIFTCRPESNERDGSLCLNGLGLAADDKNPNDVKLNEANDLSLPLIPPPIRRGRFLVWPVTASEANKVPPSSRGQ
jgi:hypothetical protein